MIKVDRQQQFNTAQRTTHYFQKRMAEGMKLAPKERREMMLNHPLLEGLDRNDLQLKGMPAGPLQVARSDETIGLQIVDVFLWLTNRVLAGDAVPAELAPVVRSIFNRAVIDSISMEGMAERYRKFESRLPRSDDLTGMQMARANEIAQHHQSIVDKALGRSLESV